MMKKRTAILIITVLLLSQVLTACSGVSKYSKIVREPLSVTYDTKDAEMFKRTSGAPQKTIQYIDMNGSAYTDLFMATSLQGLLNRNNPFMYVIHDEIVEGQGSNAAQYWFDKLDVTYTGDAAFTKEKNTDIFKMLADNISKVDGYILYHERLTDVEMVSRYASNTIYSDIAVLNLTVMLCGQKNAVALTKSQYEKLERDYNVTLTKLGDTTQFMRNADGTLSTNRADRAVWGSVYDYALKSFGGTVPNDALMHNPGFQPAHFDFAIAHKMFVFNRILDSDSTAQEQSVEKRVYGLTKNNTFVYGCWYLQMDEPGFMATVSANGKAFVGTYESYNLTWTTALPKEQFPRKDTDKITLDENKVYVAFDFSEGDFNSYVQFKMKTVYDDEGRGTVPINISIQPTLTESNPNIVKYFRDNWADGDNFVMAEAGLGYIPTPPTAEVEGEYYALTQEYMNRNDMDCIRMLSPEKDEPLRFAENLEGLSAMMLGYMGENNSMVNDNAEANFLYRDTVFFRHYFCDRMEIIKNYSDSAPGFFSISMAGWNYLPSTIKRMMDGFDDRFQVVTTTQLADLYKQYYKKEFTDITSADLKTSFNREEMGFLYYSSDHKSYDELGGSRYAENDDYFVYKFDFDNEVKKAVMDISVEGYYQMEVSNDYRNWYIVDKNSVAVRGNQSYDLSRFMGRNDDNTVYVRFGTKKDSNMELYNIKLSTEKETVNNGLINTVNDNSFLSGKKSGKAEDSGRSGAFTYKLPFSADAQLIDFAMSFAGDKSVQYSQDNKKFSDLPLTKTGNSYYGRLDVGAWSGKNVYLKFGGEGVLKQLRYNSNDDRITGIVLTPNDLDSDGKYLLSSDAYQIKSGQIYSKRLSEGNELIYKFRFASDINNLSLRIGITGQFKIAASADNKTYRDVMVAEAGTIYDSLQIINGMKQYVGSDGYLYLKISSQSISRTATLSSILFLTDKSTDELRSIVEASKKEDLVIKPNQNGDGAEGAMIYADNGSHLFLGHGYARVADTNASFVYKFDFTKGNEEFWKGIYPEFDADSMTRIKLGFDICNNYIISVSKDGVNFEVYQDSGPTIITGGENRKIVNIVLEDMLTDEDKTVFIKFEDAYKLDAGWGAMLYGTYFYFN